MKAAALGVVILAGVLAGCRAKGGEPDPAAGAPPPAKVEQEGDPNVVRTSHPEQFPLATAAERLATDELSATGVVSADVSRNVPVVSMASGRVVDIRARLGDTVVKGQLLMKVQSADLSAAFADHRRAVADLNLAKAQLDRAALLYERGAIAQKDLEIARSTEAKAKVDVDTAADRLKLLGADLDRPSPIIDILAPVSGVITEQNVTTAAGVKTLDNSPNLFTIADLSNVWVICDIYENDLPKVHVGEPAEIRLNAYPDRMLTARVSNIAPMLDPATRTAKVRLEQRSMERRTGGLRCRLRQFCTCTTATGCTCRPVTTAPSAASRLSPENSSRPIFRRLHRASVPEIEWSRMPWCCRILRSSRPTG
jgi:cobalt-zinc-cadmium efflux system membrane fusion protein